MSSKKYTSSRTAAMVPGYGRVRKGEIIEGDLDALAKAGVLVEVIEESDSKLLVEPAPLPVEPSPSESKPKIKKEKEEDVSENKPRLLTEVEPLPTDEAPVVKEASKPKRASRSKKSK